MTKRAFTLIELLIVILIISLSYVLVFGAMQQSAKEPKAITPLNLKSTLVAKEFAITKSGEFFCTEGGARCFMRQLETIRPYEQKVAFGKELTVYKLNENGSAEKVEYGRYDDDKIAFRFAIYSNKSSTQMIVEEDGERFTYLPSFFGEPKEFKSLDDAKDYWLENEKLVDHGEFY